MEFFYERLDLQLVNELTELVEINPGPEPKGMGDRLWRRMRPTHRSFAEAGTNRPVDRFLERNAELAGAPFQEPCQVVIEGERGPHGEHVDGGHFDVKASAPEVSPANEPNPLTVTFGYSISRQSGLYRSS
jgi:hypothetical protein